MTESFLQIRPGVSPDAPAGSELLSVFVGLPEKLDTEETLAADSASFPAASQNTHGETTPYVQTDPLESV